MGHNFRKMSRCTKETEKSKTILKKVLYYAIIIKSKSLGAFCSGYTRNEDLSRLNEGKLSRKGRKSRWGSPGTLPKGTSKEEDV